MMDFHTAETNSLWQATIQAKDEKERKEHLLVLADRLEEELSPNLAYTLRWLAERKKWPCKAGNSSFRWSFTRAKKGRHWTLPPHIFVWLGTENGRGASYRPRIYTTELQAVMTLSEVLEQRNLFLLNS